MGTYLRLELKDKSPRSIARANALWSYENKDGFQDTLKFTREGELLEEMEYIKLDPDYAHLREIDDPEELGRTVGLNLGTFEVKINMGDYLCSEMARRYLQFIKKHEDLLKKKPREYVINMLRAKALKDEKAKDCLVDCPYCKNRR